MSDRNDVTTGQAVSLVTGAGSGIGAAIASVLGARGDMVVCADRDLAAAQAVVGGLPHGLAVGIDVRDSPSTVTMLADIVGRYGRIDTVVPCAGTIIRSNAVDMSPADFSTVLDINLKGTFLTVTHAARTMVRAGISGNFVLIGSIHSVRAMRGQAAYAASKGALLAMAKVFAAEWAAHGIRVNTVGPGFTATPLTAVTLRDPVRLAMMLGRIPMDRPGEPAEIAKAVAFLSSNDASYITGTYLNVDGGWLVN
jgi:NAD(P)-dependent dehydrogenase (short-subunit alcohol dehydrogenase family)